MANKLNLNPKVYYDYTKPQFVMVYSKSFSSILLWLGIVFTIAGLATGLFVTGTDIQQGENYKIIYLHVPSAWISILTYVTMTICSLIFLVSKNVLPFLVAKPLSKIGAIFTLITLVTGSMWGLPVWGTYWVWDARLTSVLVLFFLYLSYIIFQNSFKSELEGAKVSSLLAIIGFINIPIIKFSVEWWSTLHQPATISQISSKIDSTMYIPLLLVFLGLIIIELYGLVLFFRSDLLSKRIEAAQLNKIREK